MERNENNERDSFLQLILSVVIGIAAGAFVIYLKRRNPGEKFRSPVFEAVNYWGTDPEEAKQIELAKVIAHEDEIREALMNDFKAPRNPNGGKEEISTPTPFDDAAEPVIELAAPIKANFEDHPAVKAAAKQVKCRHRWTKYLLQQDPKPTQGLLDALKRYERLHDKHLRDITLGDALELPLHSRSNKIRYLVWVPEETGGLPGQLLSLVSAFLFALLTDRVLLVDFPEEIEHVICEPFPRSSWLLPSDIKGKLMTNLPNAIHAVRQRQPIRSGFLKLERGNLQDDKHLLSCHGTLKAVFSHIQWLVVRSDYTFIETIQSNKNHQHQLSELFSSDNTIFSILNRYLIHPSNFLWEKITSQYHIHFSDFEPRPLRIMLHPASLNEPEKHIEVVRKVISAPHDFTDSDTVSIYVVPFEYGTECIDSEKYWKSRGSMAETISIGSSNSMGQGMSPFIGNWRKFLTDVWMAGFTHYYFVPENVPLAAVPALLYRNKLDGVLLLRNQLKGQTFQEPEPLDSWDIFADRVDCSLIKRK